MDALYQTGFANQSRSDSADDGLILTNAYVTAAVRCAPPQNKPTHQEQANCLPFLEAELNLLQPRVVMVLGRFAYDSFRQYLAARGIKLRPTPKFQHGLEITLDMKTHILTLLMSYHPSRQNTQTKKLTHPMFLNIFQTARDILAKDELGDK